MEDNGRFRQPYSLLSFEQIKFGGMILKRRDIEFQDKYIGYIKQITSISPT